MHATYLGKVLADVLRRGSEIVTKGTGIAGLAGALSEELARDMSGVCKKREIEGLANRSCVRRCPQGAEGIMRLRQIWHSA
jgi:hypothetical protein